MLNYGGHSIDRKDISAVVEVLHSNFLTQGPHVSNFEEKICRRVHSNYATAFNSATSALIAACNALGVKENCIVWTSAISFVASSNCAVICNATVDFLDISLDTFNIDLDALDRKLKVAKDENKLPHLIIVVHFAGTPCDLTRLAELKSIYGFKIIEDASHALGATHRGNPIGSCSCSEITVFSFHPVKMITTGEGGVCTTNSESIDCSLKEYRSHGITKDKKLFCNVPNNEIWNYQQHSIGQNYRMSDISAALGISQLDKLDKFVQKRNKASEFYENRLKKIQCKVQKIDPEALSSRHLFVVCLQFEKYGISQKIFFKRMWNNGINLNIHYIPIYKQPYYQKLGFDYKYCPNADNYFKMTFSLPLYPQISRADQLKVLKGIENSLG